MVAVAKSTWAFPGKNPPHYIVGNSYLPPPFRCMRSAGTLTTGATTNYYFPFAIWEAHTFAGAQVFNSGAGDNTKTLRLGIYNDDGANGGPNSLAKDFGEITLSGASALRTLTSSWAAAPGMYWGCYSGNQASAMYGMTLGDTRSDVGYVAAQVSLESLIGFITPDPASGFNSVVGLSVGSISYGALPSTAVAPTAMRAVSDFSAAIPAFWLKA